jgi:hypothetical protein
MILLAAAGDCDLEVMGRDGGFENPKYSFAKVKRWPSQLHY